MSSRITLTETLQTALAGTPPQARKAAVSALGGFRVPHSIAALRLIEEWEAGGELAAAAAAEAERLDAYLASVGYEAPDDVFAEAFQAASAPYRLLGVLGSGMTGRVYLAAQSTSRRLVALKVMFGTVAADRHAYEHFLSAAQVRCGFVHSALVTLLDAGLRRGLLYLVEELVEGQNLHQFVNAGRLRWEQALGLAANLAHGLAAIHAAGVTHGAIKPANLFIDQHGHLRLSGFAPPGLPFGVFSSHDLLTGAASYRSPEESRGKRPDTRSDLYGLGVALHHMITGTPPFSGETPVMVAMKQLTTRSPAPSDEVDVPPELRRLMACLLQRDPIARPESADAVLLAMDSLLASPPAAVPVAGRTVLVVDDSQLVLHILRRVLSGNGYTVLTAENPQDAITLAREQHVDVLLTDIVFPHGESGVDLVGTLRREFPSLAIVAMSGSAGEPERELLLGQGVSTVLAKPLAPADVLAVIGRACPGGGRSLLLVDDDRLIRLVLRRLFESASFSVRAAATLEEARQAIAEQEPDVIVSDLRLRDESGLTLLRELRDRGLTTPFIMLSGRPDAESVLEAYRLRVFEFVVKDGDTAHLIRAVEGAAKGWKL